MPASTIILRFALAAVAGAAFAYAVTVTPLAPWASVAFLWNATCVCILGLLLLGRTSLPWRSVFACGAVFCAVASGGLADHEGRLTRRLPDDVQNVRVMVTGEVRDGCRPAITPCGFSFTVVAASPVVQALEGSSTTDAGADEAPTAGDTTAVLLGAHLQSTLQEGAWVPLPGDRFSVQGRVRVGDRALHPFAFDAATWTERRGYQGRLAMDDAPVILGTTPSFTRSVQARRAQMEHAMRRYGREEAAGVLVAMSTGTKNGLSDEVRARFAAAGTAHVLAVSGLHLGLMTAALWFGLLQIFQRLPALLARVNIEALSAAITLPAIVVYVLFTGAPTSAMRAGLMAAAVLIPRFVYARGSSLHALSLAVFFLLCHRPMLIVDMGFQLSVAATLSLVLLAGAARKHRTPPPVEDDPEAQDRADGDHPSEHGGDDHPSDDEHCDDVWAQSHDHPSGDDHCGHDHERSMDHHGKIRGASNDQNSDKPKDRPLHPDNDEKPPVTWRDRLRTAATWALVSTEVSVISTLATAPFLVWGFGGLPVLSPLPNLLIVPPLSLLALPLGSIGAALDATGMAWAGAPLIRLALWVIDACLSLSRIAAPVFEVELLLGRPLLLGVIGWAAIALCCPYLTRGKPWRPWIVLAFGAGLVTIDWGVRQPRAGELQIHAIPVGQGDATLILLPDGHRLLIDAGGSGFGRSSTGTRYVVPYLRGLGIGRVHTLVATHGDADHIAGITELVPLVRPERVWVGNHDLQRPLELALYQAAKAARIPYAIPHEAWRSAHIGEVVLEFLPAAYGGSSNDGSVVIRLCYHDFCALLTGDAESAREQLLVASDVPLHAHYLKLGHHGSKTSSQASFLDAVGMSVAVAHLGPANRYGFPHAAVLDRLEARNVALWRTDQGEAIVHVSEGQGVWRLRRRWTWR